MPASRAAFAATLLLASACATGPITGTPVRWPAEPDPPRVRFSRALISEADVESGMAAFRRALTGRHPLGFKQPSGLAVGDGGNEVYVADQSLGQVLRWNFEARTLEVFAPDFALASPFGLAIDGRGDVYVSQPPRRSIQVFDHAGKLLREFGSDAERPTGIAVDRARGLLYVCDGSFPTSQRHRVLVYSLGGQLLRTIGTRGTEAGQFNFPGAVAVDGQGNVYVVDTLNARVQVFDPAGRLLRIFGERGEGPGMFARPKAIAVDRRGIVYVVDGENGVVDLFDQENRFLMAFGGKAGLLEYFQMPASIALDPAHDLVYVGDEGPAPRVNVYQLLPDPGGPAAPAPAGAGSAASPASR